MKTLSGKRLLILTCLATLMACNTQSEHHNKPEVIDVEENLDNYQNLQLTDLATEIQYIPLETTPESILGSIKEVYVTKNNILVYSNEIFLFDRKGHFLRKIGQKGKGPFEYSLLGVPRIINDTVFVPTTIPKNNIFLFSTNGQPLTSISTKINGFNPIFDNWYYDSPNILLQVPNYNGKEKCRIISFNPNGDTINCYANTTFFNTQSEFVNTEVTSNHFYRFKDRIMYKEMLNDTVWQIKNDVLIPIYVLKRGRYGVPTEYRGLSMMDYLNKTEGKIQVNKILESEHYIFFKTILFKNYPFDFYRGSANDILGNMIKRPYPVLGCYNRKTKETFFVNPTNPEQQKEPTGIQNDFDGGINFLPENAISDNEFFSWVQAYDLKGYVETDYFKTATPKYPEKKKALEKLANSLDENDNPVQN